VGEHKVRPYQGRGRTMRKDQIGIQLYTLRTMAAQDFDATLAAVAKAGYPGVEFAGFQGHTAAEVRGLLDKHGLKAFSAHIPVEQFRTNLDGVIADLQTVGATWGIVPWVAPENRTPEAFRKLGEEFNAFGAALQAAGLKFAYHNHNFEFEQTTDSGKTIWEELIAGTDPGAVSFELDAFWAEVGGYDAAEVIRATPDRIRLVHLKDASREDAKKDVPFGTGVLDWGAILSAARDAGVEYYITEQDNPSEIDPVGDVTTAFHNADAAAR
jgi:sugar phosphate isomerase/epimerase